MEEDKKVKISEFMIGKNPALKSNLKNLIGKIFEVEDSGKDIVKFIKMGG